MMKVYLRNLAVSLYESFSIGAVSEDKTPADYFYAEEINQLEQNLIIINQNTLKREYGSPPTYVQNGATMDYTELNRMESAILDLYERLTNEFEGRRMFTWNFGMKGGDI